MALDRQSIEKKDFPVGRRGYDPDAVDTHLKGLADEVAELKRTARKRSDTLASSASDQVRSIVQAAESSAADIQRDAESDAREIRDEANAEAASTREQATQQAREYVNSVSESTDTMLGRLESMQQELDSLVETLRSGGGRLSSDLKLLESNLTEVHGVVSPPAFEPEADSAAPSASSATSSTAGGAGAGAGTSTVGEHVTAGSPSATDEHPDASSGAESDAPSEAGAPAEAEVVPAATAPTGSATAGNGELGGDDTDSARLIALNMALNGSPREETARYLEENFSLADPGDLLNEVYSSVEG